MHAFVHEIHDLYVECEGYTLIFGMIFRALSWTCPHLFLRFPSYLFLDFPYHFSVKDFSPFFFGAPTTWVRKLPWPGFPARGGYASTSTRGQQQNKRVALVDTEFECDLMERNGR